ncbi:MAG: Grx4 family monothiol glutaredoxin [Pseudomonadota bacterium]
MSETTDGVAAQIENTIKDSDVVLFMKGTKTFPQCGFSSRVASILTYMKVDFKDVNVLDDDGVREGIKVYSEWPTIPQLYVKGEFVGGCDIITEMTLSGELDELLEQNGVAFDKDAVAEIRKENAPKAG